VSFADRAISTPDRIEHARAAGRHDEAAELARQLVLDAEEIHELYTEWSERIPQLLGRTPADPGPFARAWEVYCDGCEHFDETTDLEALLAGWRASHDAHLEHVAMLVDEAVGALGEECLGDLWADLQRDGIAFYRATYGPDHPWPESAARLTEVAIDGMHGHLGGPGRRGDVTLRELDDRVELEFEPCGSGGQVLAGGRHLTVEGSHDFAWNTPGVCVYCVHCCVLQQLGPIDDFGYPARVIHPPTEPGASCRWTIYRDPALVPDEAYERVGRRRSG
jgi:hypothetical protein